MTALKIKVEYKPLIAQDMGDGRGWDYTVLGPDEEVIRTRGGFESEEAARRHSELAISRYLAEMLHNWNRASTLMLRTEANDRVQAEAKTSRAGKKADLIPLFDHLAKIKAKDDRCKRHGANEVFKDCAYAISEPDKQTDETRALAKAVKEKLLAHGQTTLTAKAFEKWFDLGEAENRYAEIKASSRHSVGK